MDHNYYEIFKEIDKEDKTPSDYVEQWSDFVQGCLGGYQYSLYEYDYEILIRESIQEMIDEKRLIEFDDHQNFVEAIVALDNKLKEILIFNKDTKESSSWWKAGFLKYAGEQYIENVESQYGIKVEKVR